MTFLSSGYVYAPYIPIIETPSPLIRKRMKFTANIPEKVVFYICPMKDQTEENETYVSNTDWFDLPEDSKHQKDVEFLQKEIILAEPFTVRTKKELEKYKNDKRYFIYQNSPTKIKLVGYENAARSGSTNLIPQVLLPTGHLVTLPLDILTNTLLKHGLSKDGTLRGQFQFASINKKLKLIPLDSGIYNAVKEEIKKRSKKPYKLNDMNVGEIYRSPSGSCALFLGFVSTETMIVDLPKDLQQNKSYIKYNCEVPVEDFGVRFKKKKLATLWFDVNFDWLEYWNRRPPKKEEVYDNLKHNLQNRYLNKFKVVSSHSYIQKVDGYYIDLPNDIVNQVRNLANKKAEAILLQGRSRRITVTKRIVDGISPNKTTEETLDVIRHFDACALEKLAPLANMSMFGLGFIRSNVYKLFDQWETKENKFNK